MPAAQLRDPILKHRPRVQEACARLQEMAAKLEPGAKLPTILALHQQLGMSVQTLHRAIQQLVERGVLQSVNGIGVFVADRGTQVRHGSIGLIGVYPEMKYFSYLLRGVERYAAEHGQHTVILGGCRDLNLELCEHVDGVLMYDIPGHEQRLAALPAHLPRISMFVREANVSNVIADDYGGARLAVQYLMEHGHRRIACLMENQLPEPRLRYAGYCDALAKAGIEPQSSWSRLTGLVFTNKKPFGENGVTYLEWGRNTMQQWLREDWHETGCTAILVQNDTAAIGVMQAFAEEGIEVPGQVSVMGFDGTELCDLVTPRLTSMKVPMEEIGYTSMELLNEQVESGANKPRSIMLPLRVREGKSVSLK